MKRIFTSSIAIILLLVSSNKSFSQCTENAVFTPAETFTFDINMEGFTGDFNWVMAGSGELESTPVSAGATKVLTSPTLFLPNSATTIAWSFELGGTANVTSYTVEAIYYSAGFQTVAVCSGGILSTIGNVLSFSAPAPPQIIGTNFQLRITFTSTSTGSKVLTIDDFSSNAGASAIILPVNFSSFNASAVTKGILLTWSVASELNVNLYEVERSSDGKTYSTIGYVFAASTPSYTYTDHSNQTGSNYYRIKAVDMDGKFKYSSVILIKVGKNSISLAAYPMPAPSEITLQHNTSDKGSLITIMAVDGRLLTKIVPEEGSNITKVNLTGLKAGLYVVRYTNSIGEAATVKLIKQ